MQARATSDFAGRIEPHRRELLRHCYRMLGSWTEAEDVFQDVLVRAWRGEARFEGRAALRTWLYRIATNACLTELHKRKRRDLPQHAGNPAPAGELAVGEPFEARAWIEPAPDTGLGIDAQAVVQQRQSVALAFVLALQRLPARQRAALLLRDVVGYDANEAALLLHTSVAAANSLLSRARMTLARGNRDGADSVLLPAADSEHSELLRRYVRAWEAADVAALVELLTDDATISMPPYRAWFRGRSAIAAFLAGHVFALGRRFRMRAAHANGAPAFALYMAAAGTDEFDAHGIHVPWLRAGRVQTAVTFLNRRLVSAFGLPGSVGAATPR